MARNVTIPTSDELKEALEEYFSPDGDTRFKNIQIRVFDPKARGFRTFSAFDLICEGERVRPGQTIAFEEINEEPEDAFSVMMSLKKEEEEEERSGETSDAEEIARAEDAGDGPEDNAETEEEATEGAGEAESEAPEEPRPEQEGPPTAPTVVDPPEITPETIEDVAPGPLPSGLDALRSLSESDG